MTSGNGFLDFEVLSCAEAGHSCTVAERLCNQDCALHEAVIAALSLPALQVTIAVSFDTSFPLTEQSKFVKNLEYCLLFVHLTIGFCPNSCFSVLEDITFNTEILIQSHVAGILLLSITEKAYIFSIEILSNGIFSILDILAGNNEKDYRPVGTLRS